MKPKHWSMLAAAAAMATVIGGAAIAQGPGRMMDERGWGMWGGGMGWGPWRGGPWQRGPEAMLDRVEGRLAFIKAELKINETQVAAWNALADAVRNAAKHHNERMRGLFKGDPEAWTLPQRLDAQEELMSARLDEIKQVKGSLKSLYAVLSDEQKKEANSIMLPMVGMSMGIGIGMGRYRWME